VSGPEPVRSPDPVRSAVRRTRARRVVAFAGMLVTVAALVGLRSATTPAPTPALGSSGLVAEAGAGPGAGTGKKAAGGTAPAHQPAAGGGAPARTKHVVVGKAYDVSYGVVQVKVTISGTQITDITPLSLPQGGRSGDISQFAAPRLRSEALSAQSAHIDSVSGASYTSAGYAMSLQSALDQARR
jgi:uncharacterized protein with FMN-binding domain